MAVGINSYRPPVMGVTHMVSAGHYLAASAGYRILEQGGNAIDAGVASGIVINVTLPHATNFGGVAPIIVYIAESDKVATISGLGTWPEAASIEHFIENEGGQIPPGIKRCVVPSAPDAWLTALEKFGTMTFEEVITPALELAENGFPVSGPVASSLAQSEDTARNDPEAWASTSEVFMPNGRAPRLGEPLIQQDLARTFRRLIEVERANSHMGRAEAIQATRDYFYKGDIAEEIARFSELMGGFLSLDDMRNFSVKIEEPVVGSFKDLDIYTCGPWCQGPVVAQTLQILEDDDLCSLGHNSGDYVHLVSQALNLSFADRHHYYGDPNHIDVPMEGLLAKGYTTARRSVINMDRAFQEMPPPGEPWTYQNGEGRNASNGNLAASPGPLEQDTSYTCVVDRWGNAFSATPSDGLFGAPVVPGLGIMISSRGTQSWLQEDHASSLQPGKRPRLTPNPAMAFKDGKLFMPFGTPGGDAQGPAMVQTLLNIVEFGMDPQAAIEAPRFVPWNYPNSFWPHAYLPGRIHVEGRISGETNSDLDGRGHDLRAMNDWSPAMGAMSAIVVDHESGVLKGGADPRRDTYAIGR